MKILRIAGIAILVIFVLLAVTVGVLYAMFDGEKVKAEISRAMLQEKQRKLVIAGSPRLSVWPDVGVQLDRVTLSEHASDVEFLALDSARVSVALMPLLSRQVQVRGLDLQGLKATLVKKKDGTLNVADLLGDQKADGANAKDKPAGETPAPPVQLDIASIRIGNAQLTWRDEKAGALTTLSQLNLATGRVQADSAQKTVSIQKLMASTHGTSGADAFELKLEAPQLALSPEKSGGEAITLAVTVSGSGHRAAVQFALSQVEGNADMLKIGSLALTLDAASGESKIKGQLHSPVAVNVAAQTVALAQLAGNLDVSHPSMPMKQLTLPIAGSLTANWAQQTAGLDLRTQFDGSHVVSKVSVSRFAPLALAFDLDVDQLNVDKYLPPKAQEAGEGAKSGASGKEAPLDFSALKGPHQVSGAVRIGALQVSGLKLAQLNAKLHLAAGRLEVAPLTMHLYEGSATGGLSVNAVGNAVALRQNLTGVSVNPLMKDLLSKDMLEGRGNVALDISSHGDTVGAMKKALAGSASLSLKDGAIKGINLAQSLRDIKSKLGQPDTTQKAKEGEKTDFSELTASLKIANGVAHNEDLAAKSPFLRLAGAGDIDIGQGQMNYLAKATVVGSSEGQGGKAADQLAGLTVPVRVSGPFEGLSYKIEFASMVADVAKARVEEKKQEIKAQVEEKAKDFLKGILGR